MTTNVSYFANATDQIYSTEAFVYIGNTQQIAFINNAASKVGISAGAIAGAMAEEAASYYPVAWRDDVFDQYALSGIDPVTAASTLAAAIAIGPVAVAAWQAAYLYELTQTKRTHAEWAADYATVNGDVNPGALDKMLHPVLMDVGPANFKIFTAITLVNKYAYTYPDLGLTLYMDDYAKLATDLANPNADLTAKLYGVYLKEAEDWYKGKLAYGDQWNILPQEFKDALLVSYTNIGQQNMEQLWVTNTNNGTKLYQPLPLLGSGGGMNHLLNAGTINDTEWRMAA